MAKTTPATLMLDRLGIAYETATYDYDPNAQKIGMQAAESLGVPADRVLKTLMIEAGGKAVCAVIASNQDVSMKRLAAALGAKSAAMMKPAAAERLTGYHVGGVSPLGQKKVSPVVIDVAAMDYDRVFVNGGQRGLQVHLSPRDLAAALSAVVTDIKAI